jgi:prepilin-type N-terminal cleavage/methylation domain-containing protein
MPSFSDRLPPFIPGRRRRRPGPRRRGARGFTLVELVAVIVVVAVIFGLGSVMLGKVFSAYALKRDATDADWQAKVALERMARELRAVRSPTAADLDISSSAQIRFVDTDGNGVCFYRIAATNQLMRSADGPASACGTTTPQVLADNVTNLGFSYWQADGTGATGAANTYYITATLVVKENNSYNASFRASVRPRNF